MDLLFPFLGMTLQDWKKMYHITKFLLLIEFDLVINLIIYLYTKPKSISKSAAAGLPAFSNLFLASLNIYQKVMSITKYVQKLF